MATGLSHKQLLFVEAYVRHGVATQAMIDAGYSPKAARTEGPRYLQKPAIVAELAKRQAQVTKKTDDIQTKILAELETLAFSNMETFTRVNEDGQLVPDFSNATPEQLRAITSVGYKTSKRYDGKGNHVATDTEGKFRVADKYRGLELLGRHHGMFQTQEHRVVVDVADRLLRGRTRLLQVTGTEDLDSQDGDQGGGGAGV